MNACHNSFLHFELFGIGAYHDQPCVRCHKGDQQERYDDPPHRTEREEVSPGFLLRLYFTEGGNRSGGRCGDPQGERNSS